MPDVIRFKRSTGSALPTTPIAFGEMVYLEGAKSLYIGRSDGNPALTLLTQSPHTHLQTNPLTEWLITHGLGRKPSVEVVDSLGRVVMPTVIHNDLNVTLVRFSKPSIGSVHFT